MSKFLRTFAAAKLQMALLLYRQHKQNGIVLLNKQRLLRFVLGTSESGKFKITIVKA
mgnify:CR=1 FL=1